MLTTRRVFLVTLMFVLLGLPHAGAGEVKYSDLSHNVLVTITLGEMSGKTSTPLRSYQMIAIDGGRPVSVLSGSRIPIPVTKFATSNPPEGEILPMTSYSYQDIGFSATAEAVVGDNGRIRLQVQIEDSRIAEDSGEHPTIRTTDQQIQIDLIDGKPIRIQRVDHTGPGSGYIEIEAHVM